MMMMMILLLLLLVAAALNVVGYILGIGDRHLDNFLLDKSDGTVVPIDFGATFGAGTSSLPVPELIPFRYTPSFATIASPLPTPNLLHTLMTTAMRVLQVDANRRALISIMDVFVREPTVDWHLAAARKQDMIAAGGGNKAGVGSSSSRADDILMSDSDPSAPSSSSTTTTTTTVAAAVWYPRAKVLAAEMKLRRANPASLLFFDLLQNSVLVPTRTRVMNDAWYSGVWRGLRNV
jgi:DNA-dependent protein kinase catalytic subunit